MKQLVREQDIIALQIMHRTAHAGETFAEAKVVGRIVLWRFAFGPIPVSAILNVYDVNVVFMDNGPAFLETEVVYATDALLENLRRHNGRTNRQHHAAIQPFD